MFKMIITIVTGIILLNVNEHIKKPSLRRDVMGSVCYKLSP